ncbi:hypothetical protein K1719_040718 [Acacia pycnantha]|nr:hypothetical protein K1719_040718 [Acacia pycnantha]
MARKLFTFLSSLTLIFLFTHLATAKTTGFSRTLSPSSLGLRKEKLTHLQFYFHDIVSGRKPTAVKVAEALMTNTSLTGFGLVSMADDPLTTGPERGQSWWVKPREYMRRRRKTSTVREMPIVGGSGLFQFARGFAQAKTHTFDPKTGDAVVEYNVYVLHY